MLVPSLSEKTKEEIKGNSEGRNDVLILWERSLISPHKFWRWEDRPGQINSFLFPGFSLSCSSWVHPPRGFTHLPLLLLIDQHEAETSTHVNRAGWKPQKTPPSSNTGILPSQHPSGEQQSKCTSLKNGKLLTNWIQQSIGNGYIFFKPFFLQRHSVDYHLPLKELEDAHHIWLNLKQN